MGHCSNNFSQNSISLLGQWYALLFKLKSIITAESKCKAKYSHLSWVGIKNELWHQNGIRFQDHEKQSHFKAINQDKTIYKWDYAFLASTEPTRRNSLSWGFIKKTF